MSSRVTAGPGMPAGPVPASPFTKIASWRPAISGQAGPCGSGWVISALNTRSGTDRTAAFQRGCAWPASSGWTVEDLAGHVYTFGRFTLRPGWKVVIHTGSGTNTSTGRYWGRDYYV
jgi:hypothetical protein